MIGLARRAALMLKAMESGEDTQAAVDALTEAIHEHEDHMDTARDAIRTYGSASQYRIAIEECAELIVALSHHQRQRITLDEVIDEIADVYVVLMQLMVAFGPNRVERRANEKFERLRQRIKETV
ncbi:MAG: hypothetical protein KGS10_05630 [Chloroflexi bacterium]|nr:hypothetical protein [Chloroflexota bacterium]